jgi:carbon-monoxide dehydrogenase catalytic subunit
MEETNMSSNFGKKSIDLATQEILKKAQEENIQTAWERLESQQPQCGFGQLGVCCTVCDMGPCRIDPFGEGTQVGVCGAGADTIAARNLARKIAVGASAHSDHGRDVAHTLSLLSGGHTHDYEISDIEKLKTLAQEFSIDTNKSKDQIAKELLLKGHLKNGSRSGKV